MGVRTALRFIRFSQLLLLLLLLVRSGGRSDARSCTGQGQVHVPCDDRLALEPGEKFLLTLGGHGCYDIALHAAAPLSVAFYEAEGSLYAWRLREMQALDSDLELLSGDVAPALAEAVAALTAADTTGVAAVTDVDSSATLSNVNTSVATVSAAAVATNTHLCDNVRSCRRVVRGLSRGGVYNLVVAYARSEVEETTREAADGEGIYVSLESCDTASLSHIVGLLVVTCMGFASAMLCLCLLSEYVVGLQSLTKFRRTLQRPHVFVELAQVESSPAAVVKDVGEGVGTVELEDGEDDAADKKLLDLGAAA